MTPTKAVYRTHTISILDKDEFPANAATGTVATAPVTRRIIEVDQIDVTTRCRKSDTDDEKLEAAKRFIDRIYPHGKITA